MQESLNKARVLVEALPYIKEFRGTTCVVKIGGASLEGDELRRRFVQDVTLLSWVGLRVVVVHGGGKQVSAMLNRLGLEAKFSGGLRVTDAPSLEVVEMVLSGQINKELVRQFHEHGGRAVGITGKDGGLARARKSVTQPDLGLVGEVTEVDTRLIDALSPQFIPVVAPLAIGDNGETLNVNADPFAAALAVKLKAEKLVLLTDVEGVLDGKGKLLPSLTTKDAERMIGDGVISDGMIPKVNNALAAVHGGVRKVHIIDGRQEHALLLEIFTQKGVGTQVIAESSGS